MKKLTFIFAFWLFTCTAAFSQQEYTRILSYSQWFDEMEACTDSTYLLTNALIRPVLSTDSVQRNLVVSANVLLHGVVFEGYNNSDMLNLPNRSENSLDLINFSFKKDFILKGCKGSLPTFLEGEFLGEVRFEDITSTKSDLTINSIECSGRLSFKNIEADQFRIDNSILFRSLWIENVKCKEIWIGSDTIYGPTTIRQANAQLLYILVSQLQIQSPNPSKQETPLEISYCELGQLKINRTIIKQTNENQIVNFDHNEITDYFGIWHNEIQPITIFQTLRLSSGRFVLGEDMKWGKGIGLFKTEFNKFSFFDWPSLKGKIYSYYHDPYALKGSEYEKRLYKGETYDELEDNFNFDRLILAKNQIRNIYLDNGNKKYSNQLFIEIRDAETRKWEHEYHKSKSIESYFDWKMNAFLKKFSDYGTNPVIAIIYSIKVVLLFALFYLFLHNDWDVGSKRKIVRRLGFMLKYLQVDKGLSELDQEEQKGEEDSLRRLKTANEASTDKVPALLRQTIRWYVQSNLLSIKWRAFALRRLDILNGTYSELSKAKRTKVAFISGLWLLTFLTYTLLVKVLNAFTLSLNAFTTLGFGNIPTRGFSRYIVIVQGFIGWVLMTIFSVTLISQLLQ